MSAEISWEVIGQANINTKQLTLEAPDICKDRPRVNLRDEFKSRELSLKKIVAEIVFRLVKTILNFEIKKIISFEIIYWEKLKN